MSIRLGCYFTPALSSAVVISGFFMNQLHTVSGSEVFGGEERDAQIDPDDVDRKVGTRLQLELACARLHRDPLRLA